MKKFILTFGVAALGIMNVAKAQEAPLPEFAKADTVDYILDKIQNWYFGASVGTSISMSENTRFDGIFSMFRPSFRVEFGKNLYPQFGIRMSANLIQQRGRMEWEMAEYTDKYGAYDGNYNYSMGAVFVDGVFDFHSILFGYKEDRRFTLKGYVGLGGFYTFGWDEDKLNYLKNPWYGDVTDPRGKVHKAADKDPLFGGYGYPVDSKNRLYLAGHVGLIAEYHINDAWGIYVDGAFNGTDDGYNGVRYRRVYDSYPDIYVGLTYKLKDHGVRRLSYVHYTDQSIVDNINNQLVDANEALDEARKPIVIQQENVAYNEMLQTTVSFYIDKTFVTDAQKRNVRSVAKFMENHPDVDLIICGYADVQTAYPKYNMMLSQKRAQNVYDILTKEYGVDPSRLSMDYKGDEEQPFAIVNEWNRAVVFFIKPHEADFAPGVQDKANKIRLNSHESGRLKQTDSEETRRAYAQ